MNAAEFDDATLMAHADGALDAETSQRVEAAAASDPAVAARIRMFRETGALLSALGANRAEEALPADLAARVERTLAAAHKTDTVLPFPTHGSSWRPMALAASVALVVGAVGGLLASLALMGPEPVGPPIAVVSAPGLDAVLDTLPAGARAELGEGSLEIVSSFRSGDGAFCREFELDDPDSGGIISIACRAESGWVTRFAIRTAGSDGANYVPASSLAPLDAFLAAIDAGPPLSVEDEATELTR